MRRPYPTLLRTKTPSAQRYSLTLEEGLRIEVGVELNEGVDVDACLLRDLAERVAGANYPDAAAHRGASPLGRALRLDLRPTVIASARPPARRRDDRDDHDEGHHQCQHGECAGDLIRLV